MSTFQWPREPIASEKGRLALRQSILEQIFLAKSGHPGGSLSLVEILSTLYDGIVVHDPKHPEQADKDRVVLSKGHGVPALYSVLSYLGYFEANELKNLRRLGHFLQGHPDRDKYPLMEASTGSLGGEMQEGQVWEALMAAGKFLPSNLTFILDYNKGQIDGPVAEIMNLEPLAEKLSAFHLEVKRVDGHDTKALKVALDIPAGTGEGKPHFVIADTLKGKGISFMEHPTKWHGAAPSRDDIEKCVLELFQGQASPFGRLAPL